MSLIFQVLNPSSPFCSRCCSLRHFVADSNAFFELFFNRGHWRQHGCASIPMICWSRPTSCPTSGALRESMCSQTHALHPGQTHVGRQMASLKRVLHPQDRARFKARFARRQAKRKNKRDARICLRSFSIYYILYWSVLFVLIKSWYRRLLAVCFPLWAMHGRF